MKYLCVGGEMDGQWFECDPQKFGGHIRVPRRIACEFPKFDSEPVAFRCDDYELTKIHFPESREVSFLRLSTLMPVQAVARLISGYRAPSQSSAGIYTSGQDGA